MKNNLFKNFQNLFKKSETSSENSEAVNDAAMLDDKAFIEDILGNEENEILISVSRSASKDLMT